VSNDEENTMNGLNESRSTIHVERGEKVISIHYGELIVIGGSRVARWKGGCRIPW
jgi:hypothetical protein